MHSTMMEKIMLKNKVIKNASWIIASRIVQALLALVISMLTARYLGPSNYGIINYAASIVAFVMPLMHLGVNSVLVQEIVRNPDDEGRIIGTATVMTFLSSLLCIGGTVAFAAIANPGETETIVVCALYSILLIFQSLDMVRYWFQSKYLSKYTSIISLAAYTVVSIYKIYLLATGKSIYWFVVSNALEYAIISICSIYLYKQKGTQKLGFSKTIGRRLLSTGKYYIISELMVTVFVQTDKIMLKGMLNSEATGFYSAAVTCATITQFVFAAILDSSRPAILESKKKSEEAFERNMKRLYSIVIYFSLAQSLAISLFAPLIIQILYGNSYAPASTALRIVVWYTTFSYLGAARNIWILAEGQQKHLLSVNMLGALANVIVNFMLIPVLGISGAAIASLVTQFFTNFVTGYIIKPLRPNNKLMVESLNPRYLIELIHQR